MDKKSVEKKENSGLSPQACGLCGATEGLTKTPCCGHWMCNDEDQYVIFSYARNSCARNHRRYTVCAHHHNERHTGDWKKCAKCRHSFETEMYVYFGTNEYNFEKLENSPAFKPTRCTRCRRIISLGEDGYTVMPKEGYVCEACYAKIQSAERIKNKTKKNGNSL